MRVTYGNNTKYVLLCFTDNTIYVLCVTYGKENITMTELKDKATAPASDTEKVLNREKYLVFNHYRNAIYVRYRINGTYPIIGTIALRKERRTAKNNTDNIYDAFVELLKRFKNLYKLTINQKNYKQIEPLLSTEDKARLKQMLQNYITDLNNNHIQELKQFLSVGMNMAVEDHLNYQRIDGLGDLIKDQAEISTECIK